MDAQRALIAAARDSEPVRGLTHGFYKYPARFSPVFARAVIETFTKPGDLVLDPHVGGGTTLVEARATGREAVGVDISALAEFVSKVKCTIYSEQELETLDAWSRRVAHTIDIHRPSRPFTHYAEQGYYKHLDHPSRWRLRKAIEQGIGSAIALGTPRLEAFGRCAVLRTAQWALDGRSRVPTLSEFRAFLEETAANMVIGARELRAAVEMRDRNAVTILHRNAAGVEGYFRRRKLRTPRLVVTSPPYPGVHVLYHRWQVDGRKEAPLPFMIADKLDGAGSSFYTMGDRKYPELKTYFDNIRSTMASVAAIADKHTIIVQMVAFAEPSWQLPRYLETMEEVGLREAKLSKLRGERDGRLWRSVPSRRWYSDQRGETPASQEVVLFHRKAEDRQAASAWPARSLTSASSSARSPKL
ncbi:MAG TPA: DNA methyltransferase [Pseudolabrys sp.]|nr:DNA methyltransferase [Pseudolabrys sp.]